ncbi:hypothetical protein BN1723_006332 [Verticillium longisporum]|uniref:Bicarbonate transporter-like transmembrane domain-containing protein n=1 Tax=Verticillium longisporum TaxID=100787 RepID=A0A0G4NE76_VERLO|nr:hypothetical protein BN1723_006332 [Verticillium longisporum]
MSKMANRLAEYETAKELREHGHEDAVKQAGRKESSQDGEQDKKSEQGQKKKKDGKTGDGSGGKDGADAGSPFAKKWFFGRFSTGDLIMAGIVWAVVLPFFESSFFGQQKEITWQEVHKNFLAKGLIKKLTVLSSGKVRVELNQEGAQNAYDGFDQNTQYYFSIGSVLERLPDGPGFYLSIVAALLVFMVAYICGELGTSALFHHHIRVFLKDYGTPLTLVFFTGFVYIGRMSDVHLERLPTSVAFMPTADRDWLVDFWNISVGDIFLALPFAVLLTILFWFDHNVSSLIAQGTEFPLRKPPGFHWDFFLLGLAVGVAGILGLPFPNGLIPQAPFHTEALTVKKARPETDEKGNLTGSHVVEPSHVVEQRFSNLAQGLLTLGTMTGPLLVVLHLIPHGVLAGLFFVMGVQALEANGITAKLLFLARDRALTSPAHPLRQVRRRVIWIFVGIELLGFAVTFAITQTVAAVGFPVFIMLLIPVRALLLPKWFTVRELAALDEPTASPFIMENVGGAYGGPAAETDDMERAVSATAARRPSRRYSEQELRQRDGVFASPGAPRRSEEDVAERGMLTSTATRRSSRGAASSRAALSRVGSGGSKHD